ncbi:MAG: hypothetical protein QXM43_02485 [Desulfurococcaceae archaeon]
MKLRRDYNKLVALIKASAILFHKSRPLAVKEVDGLRDVVIMATTSDLENVLPLMSSSMRQVLSTVGGGKGFHALPTFINDPLLSKVDAPSTITFLTENRGRRGYRLFL